MSHVTTTPTRVLTPRVEPVRQKYPFDTLLNKGDSFIFSTPKNKCKHERRYWQIKINSAAAHWRKTYGLEVRVQSVPDVGIRVTRTNPNYRNIPCQLIDQSDQDNEESYVLMDTTLPCGK